MSTTISTPSYQTDAEQLAALRVPFPIEEVKTRNQGSNEVKYYEGHAIQKRLLDVFGNGVSIKTAQTIVTEDTVNLETILKIRWVSGWISATSGWGSSAILRGSNGKIINEPYKSAYTDSIKVAASKLGVALELYDSKYRDSLNARLMEVEEQEAEKAFLKCQGCGMEIEGCTRIKRDGTLLDLTAKDVAINTRKKFGKRFCLECATKAASEGKKAE